MQRTAVATAGGTDVVDRPPGRAAITRKAPRMIDKTHIRIHGLDGLLASAKSIPTSGAADLSLDDGRCVRVPVDVLSSRSDGSYSMSLRRDDFKENVKATSGPVHIAVGSVVVPIVQEEVRVEKETFETGRVTVHILPQTRTEVVDVPLAMQRIEIERVAIDRIVERAEPPREEGDVTIVPVYEEVLVVERKLRLKEEVRVRRVKTVHHERHEVELRGEEARVTRSDGSSASAQKEQSTSTSSVSNAGANILRGK